MSGELALQRGGSPSTSGRIDIASTSPHTVSIHGTSVPVSWLVTAHDPSKYRPGVVQTSKQLRRTQRDVKWACSREHMFAAAAAGVHLAVFAFNLAFWGFEGTPPDRYWPDAVRARAGIRTGRYGDLEGGKRIFYDYLARSEGIKT